MVEFAPETGAAMENEPVAAVEVAPKPDVKVKANITNTFVYTSETPRIYMARGLEVHQGDVVEWPDGAPQDGCWVSVTDSKDN